MTALRRDLWMAHLSAAAIAAQVLESMLPGLGPWFKPGLANIFTLVALRGWGMRAAITVSLTRVGVSALALGTFPGPTFWLSLGGALAALLALGLGHGLLPNRLGPVGLSLLASLAHMTGQTLVAEWLILHHPAIWSALPWFLTGAWLTGLFNGLLAFFILERLMQLDTLLGTSPHSRLPVP
ncbi:MAG: Gx transporter family protein [Magnetococcus sp. WYHC-3]